MKKHCPKGENSLYKIIDREAYILNKFKMDMIKKQVIHILAAIKYLDERIQEGIDKTKDKKIDNVKDMHEGQAKIEAIIVKNTDDIAVIKKIKEKNDDAIKVIETKLDKINKEIEFQKKKVTFPTLDKTANLPKKSRETEKHVHFIVKSSEKNFSNQLKCNMCENRFGKFSD